MNLQNNLKRFLSGIISVTITATMLPSFPAFAEETVEKYPYTMFAASDEEGAITINSGNFCVNGNIATNGTIVTLSQNFNINGTCVENANENMIKKINALYDSFFESANVIRVNGAYDIEEVNVNINKPVEASGNIAVNGNVNMTEGVMAVTDIEIDGNILNTNNSIICSRKGDINISSDNINLNGLIYAPYGDIFIDTSSLNMNSVIIIGQTITISCNNINACQSSHYATIIGNAEDDITTDPVKPTEPTQATESTEHIETTTVSENITEPLISVTTTSTVENENTDTSTVSTVTTTVSSAVTTISTSAESSQPTTTTSSNNKSEIFVYGTYDEETNSVDIKWETEEDVKEFNILTSVDGESYEVHATVDNVDEYLYVIEDGTVEVYIKVSFKNEEGDMVESDHFVISKAENGYQITYRDSDEDGICDIYEQLLGTDINNKDTDKDTLTDYEEIYITGTDPTVYDSVVEGVSDADVDCDEDNISNIEEIKIGTNPQMADSDLDDLNDYEEINEYLTYPTDEDSDDDGLKDGTEIKLGLDPNNPETFGSPDSEYQVNQPLTADNDVLIGVNNDDSPYLFSMDIVSNGDVEENIMVEESRLKGAVNNSAVLGEGIDINFTEASSPTEVVLNFNISDAYIEDSLGNYSTLERFEGIKRFIIFKYFDDVNAILPVYTEYDVENKKVYANVEGNGTYFVIDAEKWLDSLGITAGDLAPVESAIIEEENIPAVMSLPNKNILASEKSKSDTKIGKGTTGNFFETKPIDLVFAIQKCGLGDDAKIKFEFEKKLIRDLSNYAFNKYGDARIHIVAYDYQWGNSNALTNGSSVFFSMRDVEKALNTLEYNDTINGSANRALGHYLAFRNCTLSYRENTTWFVYNLSNSSTYFMDVNGNYSYDFQSVYDYFWHNGMYYSQVIDGGNDFDSILNQLIYNDFTGINDSTAISYINGKLGVDLTLDMSSKENYNSLVNNLDKNVNSKSLYGAYSSIDWSKKILDGELSEDRKFDTDKDGIPDWDEVDTSKLIMHSDGSFDLPTIGDLIDKIKSDFEKETVKAAILSFFSNTTKPDPVAPPLEIKNMADMIVNIKILPYDSDPTNPDNDGDGYWDIEDPDPLNAPEYLDGQYDFLDDEVYYILALDSLSEYVNFDGTSVTMSKFTERDDQKFRFEWCGNGYKIHCFNNDSLILTVDDVTNGVGKVSLQNDASSDDQLWEIVPYVNKDREISQQQAGLVIRSKEVYYNKTDNRYEPLYLSYINNKVEVSTERALGARFMLENIVDDWMRFGSIYTDAMGWTGYSYKTNVRAMSNYAYNKNIGIKEKTEARCIGTDSSGNKCYINPNDSNSIITSIKSRYSDSYGKATDPPNCEYSNIYNEFGNESAVAIGNYRLIQNQLGGNFPKMRYAELDDKHQHQMDYVCCEIIATYNMLAVSGVYDIKDSNGNTTNDLTKYTKLAAEFEYNNLFLGRVSGTGFFGSRPSGVYKCLNSYNVKTDAYNLECDIDTNIRDAQNYTGFGIVSSISPVFSDEIDNEIINMMVDALIPYGGIHTYFVFYDNVTKEVVGINVSNSFHSKRGFSTKDVIGKQDYLMIGYVGK